jgi:SAM-dependent methyltransferase
MNRPETIENRWDRLYAEFPDVYDAFPYSPGPIDMVMERFPIAGTDVVDLGSGSGRSAIPLAGKARSVVGVEPKLAMLAVAERAAAEQGVTNVRFVLGTSEAMPLPDGSADVVTAFTSPGDNGFIFGKRAIDHIQATGRSSVQWRFRIHWRLKDR